VQRLQIELLGGLGGNEAHGRALHGFGDRLRIAEVVLVALQVRSDIAGRHQSGVVAECLEPPAQVVGADAGLHANEAGRQVGEPGFELAPGELQAQDDAATPVEPDEVEGVLADVDAEDGDGVCGLARHSGAPYCRLPPFDAGYRGEHRRSIPLADVKR
jgi:hypothetical protein